MKILGMLLIAALLLLSACGGDETTSREQQNRDVATSDSVNQAATEPAADRDGAVTNAEAAATTRRRGTRVTVRDSEFGDMLFDSRRQAIYIFENDRKERTVCYGDCAKAWPPVLTKGKPVAGKGVAAGLLGTIRRRNGTRQVTYAGKPLYYYANEKPGEVRCHNVNLNGGFWWVVGPNGKRRP